MIRFTAPKEPPEFNENARTPGNAWLVTHTTGRPKDYWTVFKTDLANGFGSLCAYTAMHEPVGTVDHYLSCDNHRDHAYEWSNYRYASAWVNSSKGNEDDKVLDPFIVEDGWFEIILPSLQMVITDSVPDQEKERAKYTLTRLHLRDDERVIRQRQVWYQLYQAGHLDIEGLEKLAPLIARAVRKQQAAV